MQHYRVWQLDTFGVIFWQFGVFVVAFPVHSWNLLCNGAVNVEWTVLGSTRIELMCPSTFEIHRVCEQQCSISIYIGYNQ